MERSFSCAAARPPFPFRIMAAGAPVRHEYAARYERFMESCSASDSCDSESRPLVFSL